MKKGRSRAVWLTILLSLSCTVYVSDATESSRSYQLGRTEHIGRANEYRNNVPNDISSARSEAGLAGGSDSVSAVSTRRSFTASWHRVSGAKGYTLDVSTSASFETFVAGYRDLGVGDVSSRVVTGLEPGTTYYYRVRAYTSEGASVASAAATAVTASGTGLIINATFDDSVLNNPAATQIEAAITQAIAVYEQLFTDPIVVPILFRYSTTSPIGTPLSGVAQSFSTVYSIPWNDYTGALRTDGKTANDATAVASLPVNALSDNLLVSSANGRAVGLDTPTAMFADGSIDDGGPFDGIVTLNSALSFSFSRPPSANNFDAISAIEHEIDEVLGLGSNVGGSSLRPQDLFSWSAPGFRNVTLAGSRYFSIDSGRTKIVDFNQDPAADLGDWLSGFCPQATPYVQNAFGCAGQFADITPTSPEGISLDVVGYDMVLTKQFGEIIVPTPGSTFSSSVVTFSWTAGNAVAYWLVGGDEAVPEPGGSNLFSSSQTGAHSFTLTHLPTDGRTIFVRLWSLVGGQWFTPPQDYIYRASGTTPYPPVISPQGGSFKKKVVVTIGSPTPGVTIYFTTDGSEPTPTAPNTLAYAGPFRLTRSATITATAVKDGLSDSPAVSASFKVRRR